MIVSILLLLLLVLSKLQLGQPHITHYTTEYHSHDPLISVMKIFEEF